MTDIDKDYDHGVDLEIAFRVNTILAKALLPTIIANLPDEYEDDFNEDFDWEEVNESEGYNRGGD